MRRILYDVSRFAPFLRSERGALQIQRQVKAAAGDPRSALDDVGADGAVVDGRTLDGASLSRWSARRATLTGFAGTGVTWQVLDADEATLRGWSLPEARLALVSLHRARLEDCVLDGAVCALCDFSAGRLKGVSLRGARLDACDFSHAVLEGVDLTGADLRCAVLRGAWLGGVTLEGADVRGADFRGVAGLGPEARADLAGRGARVSAGWLYGLWARLLGGGDPPRPERHGLVREAVRWTWAVGLTLIPVLFFLRAALDPVNPDEPPFWQVEDEGEP